MNTNIYYSAFYEYGTLQPYGRMVGAAITILIKYLYQTNFRYPPLPGVRLARVE